MIPISYKGRFVSIYGRYFIFYRSMKDVKSGVTKAAVPRKTHPQNKSQVTKPRPKTAGKKTIDNCATLYRCKIIHYVLL